MRNTVWLVQLVGGLLMSRPPLALVSRAEAVPGSIPFGEALADHQALLQGYLDTHITRNHSSSTIEHERRFLTGWFEGFLVPDEHHPDHQRQLFLWEAMTPVIGRERIRAFSKGLVLSLYSPATVRTYLGYLRRLFEYILEYPYIPGDEVQFIVAKYGRIDQPVLEYDYPVHVLDSDDEDFVLTGERLAAFYDFVRSTYIPSKQKQLPVSRDYTMIVVAGESGLRADEICHLDLRDLFYEHSCLQTRYGKAANGSGKRVRKTIFTPFAQETMHVYERAIRPAFPDAKTQEALFLTERGDRIAYQGIWHSLRTIAQAARAAGLELPHKFSWHSLRKSFATNFMEENPDQVWLLMNLMGHLSPGTLFCYVKHTREYFEQGIGMVAQGLLSNAAALTGRPH
jgi:site-specific recombinase XerD